MKTHLSLLIFFASFVHNNLSHSACYEKQALIHDAIMLQVREYAQMIPAPASTGELDKDRLCNFLIERATRAQDRECRDEELEFLHPSSKHILASPHRFELLASDSNVRSEHYYRNQMNRAWRYRVSIELGCRTDDLTFHNEAYEQLPILNMKPFLQKVHDTFSDDQINDFHLETSRAFAQAALDLFLKQEEQQ